MAVYFFDSSAVVKRYVREIGTPWVIGLTAPMAGHNIYIARITGVEVVAAISRQGRGGGISAADAATAIGQFRYDFASQYRVIEITAGLVGSAMTLAEAHALRGYDAIQLAAALAVSTQSRAIGMTEVTLISSDAALNHAAVLEGLAVGNPNTHA